MGDTKIEWVKNPDGTQGVTWNPVTGCSHGCPYCYARRMATRLKAMGQPRYRDGFAVRFHPEALAEPLRWRKPRMVFVCSMGDLFGPEVTNEQIAAVFGVMAACPQHTFQVLTKQAKRMAEWFEWVWELDEDGEDPTYTTILGNAANYLAGERWDRALAKCGWDDAHSADIVNTEPWPLPNVVLMVTAEDQAAAYERIPWLLKTPAAIRGVSIEPMLGPVELSIWLYRGVIEARPGDADYDALQWVICGADSTRGALEMPEDWARSLRDQCVSAGVPFFYKQRVANGRKVSMPELDGRVWAQFPEARR